MHRRQHRDPCTRQSSSALLVLLLPRKQGQDSPFCPLQLFFSGVNGARSENRGNSDATGDKTSTSQRKAPN